jgi:flagellin-like hook-associated protein FlgL
MIRPRSVTNAVRLLLGTIGVVACIAAMIVVWIASDRVRRGTESLFASADRSLVAVRQRAVQTQQRVAAAKITAAQVENALADWTRQEAGERLASQIGAADKTEQLASTLQQADLGLDVAESSMALVSDVLAAGIVADASTATSIDGLIEQITALRTELTQARQFVDNVNERLAGEGEEKVLGERIEQAARLALRVVATLGAVDSRLEKVEDRLSAAQGRLQDLDARTHRWILFITLGVMLLVMWMLAGQAALCHLAWNGWSRRQLWQALS